LKDLLVDSSIVESVFEKGTEFNEITTARSIISKTRKIMDKWI
jgi:hypothetical protein